MTVEESNARISASSFCVTNPDVCLRGFKGWIRKSLWSKQMMDSACRAENGGYENITFFSLFIIIIIYFKLQM